MTTKPTMTVRVGDGLVSRQLVLKGRQAWCLDQLHRSGARGCTPLTNPALRWSDYVFKLRGLGIEIATEHEPHAGNYPGHHARYRLAVPVEVLERQGLE